MGEFFMLDYNTGNKWCLQKHLWSKFDVNTHKLTFVKYL